MGTRHRPTAHLAVREITARSRGDWSAAVFVDRRVETPRARNYGHRRTSRSPGPASAWYPREVAAGRGRVAGADIPAGQGTRDLCHDCSGATSRARLTPAERAGSMRPASHTSSQPDRTAAAGGRAARLPAVDAACASHRPGWVHNRARLWWLVLTSPVVDWRRARLFPSPEGRGLRTKRRCSGSRHRHRTRHLLQDFNPAPAGSRPRSDTSRAVTELAKPQPPPS